MRAEQAAWKKESVLVREALKRGTEGIEGSVRAEVCRQWPLGFASAEC